MSVTKTRVWTDMRVFNRSYGDGLNRAEKGGWGDKQGEEVPAQHWFWYIGFGCGWSVKSGLRGGVGAPLDGVGNLLSCRGGEDEEVFARSSS